MSIARLNFSHGSHEYHAKLIAAVRQSELQEPNGRTTAIALDTKGTEIRLGDLQQAAASTGIQITPGDAFILTTNPKHKSSGDPHSHGIFIDFAEIGSYIRPAHAIYVDDGILTLIAHAVAKDAEGFWVVETRAQNSMRLLGRKGVNIPDLPGHPDYSTALSEKDFADLQFAVDQHLDFIFVSFTTSARDIQAVRTTLGPAGAHIQVIAKIENALGVRNFDAILAAADGILVERGDLGIEIPPQRVFLAQKMMIAKGNIAGKPVICATHMLDSMTLNPRPTRAEAADVANAVLDGADCVMLSGETAIGRYPAGTVAMMRKLCVEAEAACSAHPIYPELFAVTQNTRDVCELTAAAAVSASLQQPSVRAIVVLSTTGDTARLVAKYRPSVPIVAVTRTAHVARQLNINRGCLPLLLPEKVLHDDWQSDVDARFQWAIAQCKRCSLLSPGDSVIVLQGSKGGHGNTNSLKIISVV